MKTLQIKLFKQIKLGRKNMKKNNNEKKDKNKII